MRKALVTLVIGKKYENNFRSYCKDIWSAYAEQHGFDLIVIKDPLDDSTVAASRSPAWQKCLILSHEDVCRYDQVVWIDSDVMINPQSPNICKDVPLEKIGAVDEYATPSKHEHPLYLERTYQYWSNEGAKFINSPTPTDFHKDYGLDGEFDAVVQTGVMVLSPRHHKEILENVYYSYKDKGEPCYNYEMRPLSYEILRNSLACWLSPKFNFLWIFSKQFHYPFLDSYSDFYQMNLRKALRRINLDPRASLLRKCTTTAFLNNYFLHFAGTAHEMKYVDTEVGSVFEI